MSAARDEVLGRVRAALADRAGPPAAPAAAEPYESQRPHEPPADLERLFADRVEDYRARVTAVPASDVRDAVAAACARHGARRLAVPAGYPGRWLPEGLDVLEVSSAGRDEIRALDTVDGVLTASALAIAETGTIVLDGGAGQGPRAATLLPDLHVCVVDATTIVAGVADAISATRAAVAGSRRPLTFISGPSATSDIELDRVEGVHGPRRLEVVVARSE